MHSTAGPSSSVPPRQPQPPQTQPQPQRLVRPPTSSQATFPRTGPPPLSAPPRRFSWRRPFQFALRPGTLIFIISSAVVLTHLDPFGLNDITRDKFENMGVPMGEGGPMTGRPQQAQAVQVVHVDATQPQQRHGVEGLQQGVLKGETQEDTGRLRARPTLPPWLKTSLEEEGRKMSQLRSNGNMKRPNALSDLEASAPISTPRPTPTPTPSLS